jgi:hypothetical protein
MRECFKVHLYWQGIVHDLSKYSPTEFLSSGKYFTGISTLVNEERKDKGYSMAWVHHQHRNKHHWQHWIDIKALGDLRPIPIPDKYVLEMACDIVAASRTYLNKDFGQTEPLKYIMAQNAWIINPDSERYLMNLLREYAFYGKFLDCKV